MSDDFWIKANEKLEAELALVRAERDQLQAKVDQHLLSRYAGAACGRCKHWVGSHEDGKCVEPGCDCQ